MLNIIVRAERYCKTQTIVESKLLLLKIFLGRISKKIIAIIITKLWLLID